MNEELDTIEHESGLFRARILYDDDPFCPLEDDDEVTATVVASGSRGGWTWDDEDPTITEAVDRFRYFAHHGKYANRHDYGKEYRMLERYMRVFHDTTVVVRQSAGIVPSDWADIAYAVEGTEPEARRMLEAFASGFEEYRAGEVYGIIIEKRDSEDRDDDDAWVDVDACWGFVGEPYVRGEAEAMLAHAVKHSPLQLELGA